MAVEGVGEVSGEGGYEDRWSRAIPDLGFRFRSRGQPLGEEHRSV